MREVFVVEKPSEEELAATYNDLTFAEFKALSDTEIENILLQHKAREEEYDGVWPSVGEENTPEAQDFFDRFGQDIVLRIFLKWRQYGIPDRNVSRDEVIGYVSEIVNAKLSREPEYGAVPDDFKTLEDDEKNTVISLFEYFGSMRQPYEYIGIDENTLYNNMRFAYRDVEAMVVKGILEPSGSYPAPDGNTYKTFWLAQRYYECWLVRQFPQSDPSDQTVD